MPRSERARTLRYRAAAQRARQTTTQTAALLLLLLLAFGAPYRRGKAGRDNPQGGAHGCATFL
ncbi:hypothetical protein XAP3CFBP6996_020945 [Xanthomonas citri pv. fuscans CFBP 6996]|nr:hypothetical protein XAP3CFBP6996_020945 [Xanthomonas citri pv. fuscans CFBP 6996]QWN18128.1 hypothetical protein DGN02_21925 [Xanthomonas citri]SOO21582.1 exported hypothetical protein [Xanthomonas citri pv. fuscans]SOO35738.1 exported hypothetical protein [Xanthomonas citri pv. fuscans]